MNKEQPFLKGWKNLSLHRDAGVCLISKNVIRPEIADKARF